MCACVCVCLSAEIIPRHSRKEIVYNLYKEVVEAVPLFRRISPEAQREICFRLRTAYRMTGVVITEAGTKPDYMYLIRSGQVQIRSSGAHTSTASRGDLFGELAIMGLTPAGLRIRTARAASVCELLQLSRGAFEDLLSTQPGLFAIVRSASRMHIQLLKEHYQTAKDRVEIGEAAQLAERALGIGDYAEVSVLPRADVPAFTIRLYAVCTRSDVHSLCFAQNFHDTIANCQWELICTVIEQQQECHAIRKRGAAFDSEKILALEESTGQKMMRTTMKIQFNTLRSLAHVTTGFLGEEGGLFVVTWPGNDSLLKQRLSSRGLLTWSETPQACRICRPQHRRTKPICFP